MMMETPFDFNRYVQKLSCTHTTLNVFPDSGKGLKEVNQSAQKAGCRKSTPACR